MRERIQVRSSKSCESLMGSAAFEASLSFLASLQLRSGMIPWFKGGRADPWNHAEAAMALALGGRLDEALAGVKWLMEMQNRDGSWCHFYLSSGVAEPRMDTNTCSYPVVLVAVLDRLIGDRRAIEPYVEMALRGLDYVIAFQRDDGSIPWAVDPDGSGHPTSLIAASSSICDSLMVAADLDGRFGIGDGVRYEEASVALNSSVSAAVGPYSDTSSWAMDHYYPVLGGVNDACRLTEGFLSRFYLPDWGIRCILGNEWFTTAETAETAMALHIAGEEPLAQDVYLTLERFRGANGGYLTGMVGPTGASFPHLEQSSYSAAAAVISSCILAVKARKSIGSTILSLFS